MLPSALSAVLLNRYFPLTWMTIANPAMVPKPAALKGTFVAEGPFPGQHVDDTWWHSQESVFQEAVQVHLSVAAANVLTLDPGSKAAQVTGLLQTGRIATLQAQFAIAGHHMIGLQECRTQSQVARHSSSHLVFQSGASSGGQYGCELWLDRVRPYASSATQKFCFQHDHVHIASFDPRHLLAIIRAPHMHIRIPVVHAPHQFAQDIEFSQWWNQIHEMVIRTNGNLPLIVLGDMNARLGSVVSDSVNSFHAELETKTGHCLHAFMMEYDLFAPSTFAEFHTGPPHTWTAPEGSKHRLDFVLLPMKWRSHQIRSFVQYEVDLCTVRSDHEVVAVEIRMASAQSQRSHIRRHRIDTRMCEDPSAKRKFLDFLSKPPQIDWSVGVGLHAEMLTQWLQQGTKACFQPSKPLPRQRYMSNQTWQIVQVRKTLRHLAHQAEWHCQLLLLCQCFQAWRHLRHSRFQLIETSHDDSKLIQLHHQIQSSCALFLHLRNMLHSHARQASKNDRIQCAQRTIDSFLESAQGHNSRELYRCLKPLLGQTHRKASTGFRPIPAVRQIDQSLAPDHDTAASRWQQHFLEPEQGIAVNFDQMRELALIQTQVHHPDEVPFDLKCVPTLEAIESHIHRSRRGKCPGIDGLPSEIYQFNPSQMALILWPLMSKIAIRCAEPLRWRGGEIFALPKVRNPGASAEHYRSILLADYSSKICHGMLRKRLLPALSNYKLNMQAGGIPGIGTDMLQLHVQSFVQLTCTAKQSCALIFVDIRQAFYQACRPLLVRRYVSEEMLANLFSRHNWSVDSFHAFRDRIREPPALEQAHVSAHERAQVSAMLTGTWFHMRGSPQTLTSTSSGTRPGDSMADILFAFMMSRFLESVRNEFVHAGLHSTFPVKWIPHGPIAPGDIPEQHVIQASWVDDFVLLLRSEDPQIMLAKVRTAIGIVQDVAASYALRLNYHRDKTSALLTLRGKSARSVWSQLLAKDPAAPSLDFECASLDETGHLAIVPDYVYLGQLQDGKGHPASEIHRRFLDTQVSSRLLRRNVFRSPRMPVRTKMMLFKSLVLSKLTFGSSAWQHMHIQTAQKWSRQLIKLYSSASPHVKHGPGVMNIDIIADCRLPHPLLLLAQQRFSLYDRLVQSEMLELYSLLQAQQEDKSWFQLVLRDVQRLAEDCPAHDVFAEQIMQDPHQLAQYVHQHPRALTKLGKWAVKHYQRYLSLWKSFRAFQRQFHDVAAKYGITWHPKAVSSSLAVDFECSTCQARFATFQALCTHEFKRHSSVNVAQRYAVTNQCRACLKVYASRAQLVHHLKYFRTGCLLKLVTSVSPLDDTSLQELLQVQREEHQARKRQNRVRQHMPPMVQAAGPIRPWPWQKALQLALADQRPPPSMSEEDKQHWIDAVLSSLAQDEVNEVYAQLVTQPYHGSLAQQLLCAFDALPQELLEDKVSAHLDLLDAIHLWQNTFGVSHIMPLRPVAKATVLASLAQVRVREHDTMPDNLPMHLRRQIQIDKIWLDSSVPMQLQQQISQDRDLVYHFPEPKPFPCAFNPIFLYVFSGRRRPGDYEGHLQRLLNTHSISGHVLMLDLALSDDRNVKRPELVQRLVSWFEAGVIGGYLVAPPCETWSEARFLEEPGFRQPRPLRSHAQPIALPCLTIQELEQLDIANFLLYVAIHLLLLSAVTRTPGIMEHPRAPKDKTRPTIWKLPWVQAMIDAKVMTRHLVWQAEFGSETPKPTHFGVVHIRRFQAIMRQHKFAVDWKSLSHLGGRADDGTWKTMRAKEYPSRLNEALACAHLEGYQAKHREALQHFWLPNDTVNEFRMLYKGDVEFSQQAIAPDFNRAQAIFTDMD